jgi:hypothetical protein
MSQAFCSSANGMTALRYGLCGYIPLRHYYLQEKGPLSAEARVPRSRHVPAAKISQLA